MHRYRHLLLDLAQLLPHSKKDAKLDTKSDRGILNEVADMKVPRQAPPLIGLLTTCACLPTGCLATGGVCVRKLLQSECRLSTCCLRASLDVFASCVRACS